MVWREVGKWDCLRRVGEWSCPAGQLSPPLPPPAQGPLVVAARRWRRLLSPNLSTWPEVLRRYLRSSRAGAVAVPPPSWEEGGPDPIYLGDDEVGGRVAGWLGGWLAGWLAGWVGVRR